MTVDAHLIEVPKSDVEERKRGPLGHARRPLQEAEQGRSFRDLVEFLANLK